MTLKIIPYRAELKKYFYDINKEWISQMFVMEEIDEKVLSNPEDMILNPGGYIWFVEDNKLGIIGTAALRKTSKDSYELTKMGVFKKARGLKAGEFLLQHVVDFVTKNKIPNCYLLTNKACEAAIHLYLKNGFVHDEHIKKQYGAEYERADVAMRLALD